MESSDILINIRKVVRSINLESKRIQKEYGISIPQLLTLNHLNNSDRRQSTHKQVMELLALNSSTVTGIINRLVKKGYIARLAKGEDKRVTRIGLTSDGENLLKQTPILLHERLADKLSSLSQQQLDEIQNSLKKLVNLLGVEKVEAAPLITIEDHIVPKE